MTRTWLRWLPAITVPAVIAAGVLAGSLPASAGDPLPAKSPEQVLQLIAQHREVSFSGTLEQTSKLGLPELPQAGPGASSGETGWLELLTGPHTARVYRDGTDNARVQVMDRLAERDVIRHGNDLWLYNSKDNTAAHAVLPAGTGSHQPSGQEAVPAPDTLAEELLAKLDPSTDVTVGAEVQVAGRAAYQLMLTPKSSSTLVASVAISVDGQSGMPLGVELKARGQSDPAFRVAFTKLSLEPPDAAVFQFSPPPGATVKELPATDHKSSGTKDRPAAKDSRHNVSGTGWESVVELPAGAWAKGPAQQPGGQSGGTGNAASLLAQATVPVSGGRLLSTALINVLILDDGRVFAGSVPLDRLQAAAAAR
ncbi:outer membrane lipoprotein carrier protein LolA [Arthrobacter sp. 2YAF22_2]|uniref:LolA family protein n=1 Tax=Arthrobacter sp. 2YAF22_2 TaxID=3233029 RepID=UPI003F932153